MLITVIIPCFNEEKVIRDTYRRLSSALDNQTHFQRELLFVDDGSTDGTHRILKELVKQDPRINLIRFSRNFGHQAAVSAGICYCQGDLAVIIDADLQDPPEIIPAMIEQLISTESNVVYGVRKCRKGETLFKRITASLFYWWLNRLSEVPLPLDTGDFRVIDRKIINTFNRLQENNKYIRGLISWMGFKQTPFYYERDPRYAGSTKYTLRKMVRLASIGVFYFSKKPLKLATTFGFLSVAAGLLLSLWIFCSKLLTPQYSVSGWTSIMLLVIYFGGVQLLTIGILGQYIGSLFDEIKARPEYILDNEVINEHYYANRQSAELPTRSYGPQRGNLTFERQSSIVAAGSQRRLPQLERS
jgi:glycosyltransferase involved in cell wall biosynthesis